MSGDGSPVEGGHFLLQFFGSWGVFVGNAAVFLKHFVAGVVGVEGFNAQFFGIILRRVVGDLFDAVAFLGSQHFGGFALGFPQRGRVRVRL